MEHTIKTQKWIVNIDRGTGMAPRGYVITSLDASYDIAYAKAWKKYIVLSNERSLAIQVYKEEELRK